MTSSNGAQRDKYQPKTQKSRSLSLNQIKEVKKLTEQVVVSYLLLMGGWKQTVKHSSMT